MKTTEQNKRIVLEAFDTLFNKRDYAAAEKFWSPDYIQHSSHIEPGREGLFNLVKNSPATLKYEPGLVVADGDYVILHGRFSGFGLPVNWIVADILRIENGVLVEHWDVIQAGLRQFGGNPWIACSNLHWKRTAALAHGPIPRSHRVKGNPRRPAGSGASRRVDARRRQRCGRNHSEVTNE